MATERSDGPKAERIEMVVQYAQERLSGKDASAAERFIRQYYERVPPQDVLDSPTDSLYASAFALWKFGEQCQPGAAKVRVFNPTMEEQGWRSARLVVETVTDNMPFLLDSMLAELGQRGHGVQLIVHPVLRVRRDDAGKCRELADLDDAGDGFVAESWMHFEIDALSDDAMAELQARIERVLADVRAAVEDWRPVLAKLDDAISELAAQHDAVEESELAETNAFLAWIRDDHFTFLGYREYTFHKGGKAAPFRMVDGSGLGILRNPDVHVLTGARRTGGQQNGFLESVAAPIMITKTSGRSNVHRPGHMDYIGIKRFAKNGALAGEHRFIGLFTSAAYNRSPRDIPLLRRKVIGTVEQAGFSPIGHDGKALITFWRRFRVTSCSRSRKNSLPSSRSASCICWSARASNCSPGANSSAVIRRASCSSPAKSIRPRCADGSRRLSKTPSPARSPGPRPKSVIRRSPAFTSSSSMAMATATWPRPTSVRSKQG